jgi:pimeloyl-ACP methyl ester carboxylesterase
MVVYRSNETITFNLLMLMKTHAPETESLAIQLDHSVLHGDLTLPEHAAGLVIFAHGSGSSRNSSRNRFVAQVLQEASLGTFLFDLLTEAEEEEDNITAALRFDIPFLAQRLAAMTLWARSRPEIQKLKLGYFGASTGGAAALVAAAQLGKQISAVVSRGGRPDLARDALPRVLAPTLLIVGEFDGVVVSLNESAFQKLRCEKKMEIVPRATHLFEEPGALEHVAHLAAAWFSRHLGTAT